jgi:hypothetical protein
VETNPSQTIGVIAPVKKGYKGVEDNLAHVNGRHYCTFGGSYKNIALFLLMLVGVNVPVTPILEESNSGRGGSIQV